MDLIPNPIFLLRITKSYFSDIDRIWRYNNEKLKKYQDKALRKMVKYAYTVPLYKKKYRENGIHPDDIKGIDDIQKLPLITKNDLREHFPNGIIPEGVSINRFWRLDTSGTTGKPLSIFRDLTSIAKDQIIGLRCFKFCNYDWRIDRLTMMGAYTTPGRYDYAFYKGVLGKLGKLLPVKNIQYVGYFFRDTEEKIKQMNKFNPNYLFGFPGDIKVIATYKKNGYANFSPKCIVTSGGNLDNYSKEYIENIFNTRVFDAYTSVEMGTAAFQCEYGNYHVNSDIIYFEFLDDEKKPVPSDKPGHVVMTKLFGKGTPLIRYTGLEDIITPLYEKCSCGLETMLIKHIEGRAASYIILPDNKRVTPYALTANLNKVMHQLKSYKILQSQIIQEKIDRIEIHVVIDEKQRDKEPSISRLFKEIIKEYQKIFGPEVEIIIKEVKEIKSKSDKPSPEVISKVHSGY